MANTANLQELLKIQSDLLSELHQLGEQILASAADDQLDKILDLVEARVAAFEHLKGSPLPAGIRLPDLVDHPDPELRSLARRVRAQVQAVLEQDKQLQERLLLLHNKVGVELQKTQLALQVERTYHPPVPSTGGAFLDKRR